MDVVEGIFVVPKTYVITWRERLTFALGRLFFMGCLACCVWSTVQTVLLITHERSLDRFVAVFWGGIFISVGLFCIQKLYQSCQKWMRVQRKKGPEQRPFKVTQDGLGLGDHWWCWADIERIVPF